MTDKDAIRMIDDYLLDSNNINQEWVEVLRHCLKVLLKNHHESNQKLKKDGE